MVLKILIAEDDDDIAVQYKMILEECGHLVYRARNGQECLNAYRYGLINFQSKKSDSPFDVVLVDYLMPIKDGVTLTKEILQLNPEQRVIFVTAYGSELLEKVKDFDQKVEILTKPLPLTALVAKIEKKRQQEVLERFRSGLKEWDGIDGFSVPTGRSQTAHNTKLA